MTDLNFNVVEDALACAGHHYVLRNRLSSFTHGDDEVLYPLRKERSHHCVGGRGKHRQHTKWNDRADPVEAEQKSVRLEE